VCVCVKTLFWDVGVSRGLGGWGIWRGGLEMQGDYRLPLVAERAAAARSDAI